MMKFDESIKEICTPEEYAEIKRKWEEITESPDFKRFCYLGDRYHSGEATPEEREEYEKETEWMRNLPQSPIPGLIPDDHPLSMGGFPSTPKKRRRSKKESPADPGSASP